ARARRSVPNVDAGHPRSGSSGGVDRDPQTLQTGRRRVHRHHHALDPAVGPITGRHFVGVHGQPPVCFSTLINTMTETSIPPTPEFLIQLRRTYQAIRVRLDSELAATGLTTPQYIVLGLLEQQGELSSAALARPSLVTARTIDV